MLKRFIASILAPIIAEELQNSIERIEDIERSINLSLSELNDNVYDLNNKISDIDSYSLARDISDNISIDERSIAREIADNMDDDNSQNWNDLWDALTPIENQLKEVMKALNIQSENQ